MTENFLTEFAKEYGLKEAVILTKICETMRSSDKEGLVFTIEGLQTWFKYFTTKQIRTGIEKLLEKKVIRLKRPGEKTFGRTLYYEITEKVVVQYFKIMDRERRNIKEKAKLGA